MPLSRNPFEINDDSGLEASFLASTSQSEDSCLIDMNEQENIEIVERNSERQLIVAQDALNVIIQYHMDGEGNSTLTREILKQSALFVVSIFGVMFYYVPAKTYAESICADPRYKDIPCDFFVINHVAGTMVVAGGILMAATNAFLDRQKAEYIPLKLENYLKHFLTPKQKLAEDAVTFLGSFVASIPFMIITVVNPIPGLPKLVIISQAFIVGVTNTLLHLLPFKLALKNPLYRLPFLPIEFTFHSISQALLNEEEKQEKELQKQINLGYQIMKQRLINHLDQAQRLLSIYGFRYTGCNYTHKVEEDIRNIKKLNQSPLQLLTQLLDRLHQISPDRTIYPSGRINNFFRKMVYIPGASWVILACAGFWGGTFNEMTELTGGLASGTAISAPSIYCLGVLLAFFGGNALQNSYDYLTAWKDDSVKVPLAFKLYPKTSVLLILISMYLSAFSYAAGAQLINDNFNGELEFLRPYLLNLAKTGLTFLGFTAMIDFFTSVLRKFAQYGGTEKEQTVAHLLEAFSQMKDSIYLMKPSLLIDSLNQANEDQLISILHINDENDREDLSRRIIQIQIAENLKTKIIKEISLIYLEGEANLLLNELKNDQDYAVEKIEALLKLNLPLSLSCKEACQDYKRACELMNKLNSVNLVAENGLNTSSFYDSINDDTYAAGPSTERTRLLPIGGYGGGGSILSNFYRPGVSIAHQPYPNCGSDSARSFKAQ